MIKFKRVVVVLLMFFASAFLVMGQSADNQETSVEQSYLQETTEIIVIREQSRAESKDMKLVALDYIGDAIERGNTGDEIRNALEYLGTEGTLNRTMAGGRITNNFPDVRAKAATYLGQIGTPEARTALIKMVLIDNEPMVLTEAVKSLGKIGTNENNDVVTTISWIVTRFDVLNPDNLLALSALDAYEKIAAQNNGIKDTATLQTIMRIANGRYIKPVQDRAKQLLTALRKYSQSN